MWTVLALLGVLLAAWRWAAVAETGTVLSWAGATGWTVLAAVAIVRAVRLRAQRKADDRRS